MVRLGLYTIPYTGTRFVLTFLHDHGLEPNQRHVSCERKVPEWRHILTVRNPYDCYLTHLRRDPNILKDTYFVAMWGHYIWRTQWQDAFYVALDIEPEWRQTMLRNLIMFCGGTPDNDLINERAEKWPKIGHTEPGDEKLPKDMIEPLKFAHEWYEWYTKHWGAHFRNSDNILGEGA